MSTEDSSSKLAPIVVIKDDSDATGAGTGTGAGDLLITPSLSTLAGGKREQKAEPTPRKRRGLVLALWKVWLLRRHNCILSTLEILVPISVSVFLLVSIGIPESKTGKNKTSSATLRSMEPFKEFSEKGIIDRMAKKIFETSGGSKDANPYIIFAYTPNDNISTSFIDTLKERVNELVDQRNATSKLTITWKDFKNEQALETFSFQTQLSEAPKQPGQNSSRRGQIRAIVLPDWKSKNWEYKIRLPRSFETPKLFRPKTMIRFVNGLEYIYDEFVGLTLFIEKAMIEMALGVPSGGQAVTMSLQKMPFPFDRFPDKDPAQYGLLTGLVSLGLIFTFMLTVKCVVAEKSSGFREILKIHGLSNWTHILGWTLNAMVLVVFSSGILSLTYSLTVFTKSDGSILWILIMCYGLQWISLAFVIAAIFRREIMATIFTYIFCGLCFFAAVISTQGAYIEMTVTAKLFLCLLPDFALAYGIFIIFGFENQGKGIKWSDVHEPFIFWDNLKLRAVLPMMLLGSVFYIAIAVYLDNVLPSKFGVRKGYLYPLRKSTWCGNKKKTGNTSRFEDMGDEDENEERQDGEIFEPIDNLVSRVCCRNLTKTFDNKAVVDNVNTHFYSGQITTVLGHNGSGKTTLISMATGLLAPSTGTVIVNGCDITKDLSGARQSMSICPQDNMQSHTLNSMEHLQLFALLNGSSFKEASGAATELMEDLNLMSKKKTPSRRLSSIEKRKLQLGMALIGGNEVLFLDEPFSGMDISTRRELWDILNLFRNGRTIIISTHYMEDADLFSDRIVVMKSGKVECSGSPTFLKKIYGTGCTLCFTMSLRPPPLVQTQSLTAVQPPLPSASVPAPVSVPVKNETKKNARTTPMRASFKSLRKVLFSEPPVKSTSTSDPDPNPDPNPNSEPLPSSAQKAKSEANPVENSRCQDILSIIQQHIPTAKILSSKEVDELDCGLEVSIPARFESSKKQNTDKNKDEQNLQSSAEPTENNAKTTELKQEKPKKYESSFPKFPKMLQQIESKKEKWGLKKIRLSFSAMDDVFEKIGALNSIDVNTDLMNNGIVLQKDTKDEKKNLQMQQFRAFLLKNWVSTKRNLTLFISQVLLPLVSIISIILYLTSGTSEPSNPPKPPRRMSLSEYSNPITLFTSSGSSKIINAFKSSVGSSAKEVNGLASNSQSKFKAKSNANLTKFLETEIDRDIGGYIDHYILAAELNDLHVKMLFSAIATHAAPLAVNTASNTILNSRRTSNKHNQKQKDGELNVNPPLRITLINHPLEKAQSMSLQSETENRAMNIKIPVLIFSMGMMALALSFIVLPAREKISGMKHLQLMVGASPISYWGAFFICDWIILLITFILLIILFPLVALGRSSEYLNINGIGVFFTILLIFGYCNLFIAYYFSNMDRNASYTGRIIFLWLLYCLVIPIIYFVYDKIAMYQTALPTADSIFQYFPSQSFQISMFHLLKITKDNEYCARVSDRIKDIICQPGFKINANAKQYRVCCPNCAKDFRGKDSITCFKPEFFFKGIQEEGISRQILIQWVEGTIFLALLLQKEYKIFQKLSQFCCPPMETERRQKSIFEFDHEAERIEEEVNEEIERVEKIIKRNKFPVEKGYVLLINHLKKSFKNFTAIKDVSLRVKKGQCFAILGGAGAGKSSVIRILAGQDRLESGNAYFDEGDGTLSCNLLASNRKKFLSHIGYCPENDWVTKYMTGREILMLMANLRGTSYNEVGKLADTWLAQMGLEKSGNFQFGKYSGGMKRKLAVSLSLIGGPDFILMDDPMNGVDSRSRRLFAQVLKSVQSGGQRTIMISSHSTDECELISDSLCIMVNGRILCIGGVDYLKRKFPTVHILTLRLKNKILPNADNSELEKLKTQVEKRFKPCKLKDEHENFLEFITKNTQMNWSIFFEILEDIRQKQDSLVQEYHVREATLEQVFSSIINMQHEKVQSSRLTCKKCWQFCCEELFT